MDPQNVNPHKETSDDTDLDKQRLTFVEDTINAFIKFGGSLVSEENYQERLQICKGCDKAGTVKIPLAIKTIELPGCTVCGCPFSTKPRAKKYFSFTKLRIVPSVCPHPEDGNKWEEADQKFL